MKRRRLLAGAAALAASSSVGRAAEKTKIVWWHAMTAALGRPIRSWLRLRRTGKLFCAVCRSVVCRGDHSHCDLLRGRQPAVDERRPAFAAFADHHIAGRTIYRTLLIWPYAVAPAVSAVLWLFMLNPQVGLLGRWLNAYGIPWDYAINGGQAMLMVIVASAWKQVSYNFIFFLAGLQSIPRAVVEAARMDGAKGWLRFRTITFPLLAPTTFFLLVVNLVYAAFDTFGTIYALTHGGPGKDTETLVIKVYRDGVVNLDLGSSSAQSVVLMAGVIALTTIQFRFIGRRTNA